jgi:uncharacterized MAPEG superfamily protein
MELFEPYKITLLVAGLTGLMMLIQILIADVAAIKVQHTPGYPVKPDHTNFLFRAARAHANTNESIAVFILFLLFGLFSNSNALYLNAFSSIYLVSRIAHMCFYYGNFKLARSISFPLSLIGLIGMFITGLMTFFNPW